MPVHFILPSETPDLNLEGMLRAQVTIFCSYFLLIRVQTLPVLGLEVSAYLF